MLIQATLRRVSVRSKTIATVTMRSSIKTLAACAFLLPHTPLFSQDSLVFTPLTFEWDGSGSINLFQYGSYVSIDHHPTAEDSLFYREHTALIKAAPTQKNHEDYYKMACSLWELNKLNEAEIMFNNMLHCQKDFYTGTYYHASDIPGDTTVMTYGYGSYTFNYKNQASRYLAKIYLEQKKFDLALKHLQQAIDVYPVTYTCGTGYAWYRNEIDDLYGLCYDGLGKYEDVISLFIKHYPEGHNDLLVKAIQKTYSQEAIDTLLKVAEKSIAFSSSTFETMAYRTSSNANGDEETEEIKYTTARGSMELFGHQVEIPAPLLENGQVISIGFFVKQFRESFLYQSLSGL